MHFENVPVKYECAAEKECRALLAVLQKPGENRTRQSPAAQEPWPALPARGPLAASGEPAEPATDGDPTKPVRELLEIQPRAGFSAECH